MNPSPARLSWSARVLFTFAAASVTLVASHLILQGCTNSSTTSREEAVEDLKSYVDANQKSVTLENEKLTHWNDPPLMPATTQKDECDSLETIDAWHHNGLKMTFEPNDPTIKKDLKRPRLPPHRPEYGPQLSWIADQCYGGCWGDFAMGEFDLIRDGKTEHLGRVEALIPWTFGPSAEVEDLRGLLKSRIECAATGTGPLAKRCPCLMAIINDIMEESPDKETTSLLIQLLDDPDLQTRQFIALGLARLAEKHPDYQEMVLDPLSKRRELLLPTKDNDMKDCMGGRVVPAWLVGAWSKQGIKVY